jgi:nickel/cobalt transporter (NicO) family protein
VLESALYLISSFWLGAMHAATPGHGKTVSAAYLVGTRGRTVDALALGVFVTLAHTSGIVAFGLLATLGSAALSQRAEAFLSLAMALLMFGLGLWLLVTQVHKLRLAQPRGGTHTHFGVTHSHRLEVFGTASERPSWTLLLGLGLAGGLLPDPAALAVLLGAIASGKLVLGLMTVFLFSLGFASVLVLVGVVVGRLGRLVLDWSDSRWLDLLQVAVAVLIAIVGAALTVGALRTLAEWQ